MIFFNVYILVLLCFQGATWANGHLRTGRRRRNKRRTLIVIPGIGSAVRLKNVAMQL